MAGTFWAIAVVPADVVDHDMIYDETILEDCVGLEETSLMTSENLQIFTNLAKQITSMLHTLESLPQDKKICVVETH
jgi:hypothetical protein